MIRCLRLDEIIAHYKEIRENAMHNAHDVYFDSACPMDESTESDKEPTSISDHPMYDEFDEGYYDDSEPINVFRTSMAVPGAENTISLTVNGRKMNGIIDTGAMKSCLKCYLVAELDSTPKIGRPVRLVGIKPDEPVTGYLSSVNLIIGKYSYKQNVVIAGIQNDFILGADFLAEHNAMLDLRNHTVAFDNDLKVSIQIKTQLLTLLLQFVD